MKYDLALLVRRSSNPRRSVIPIRPITPPATLATNLFTVLYRPILRAWHGRIPAILTAYERTISVNDALTRDAAGDIQGVIDEAGGFLNRLILTLLPGLQDWAVSVERWQRGRWIGNVLSATGVSIDTLLLASGTPTSVEETIAWNTALIKDVSAQAQSRISNIVFTGVREVRPASEVAREIREAMAMSRRRSIGIASDQLTKLTAALDRERRNEAGINAFKWRSSHKRNFRPEHQARDGKRYTEETAPKDRAGTLPYCGCREQALLELS